MSSECLVQWDNYKKGLQEREKVAAQESVLHPQSTRESAG